MKAKDKASTNVSVIEIGYTQDRKEQLHKTDDEKLLHHFL